MAQFRVEFVQDPSSGKYLAEMYNPDNNNELVVRTEAAYPTQEAAVLALVQLFKSTLQKLAPRRKAKKAKPPGKIKKTKKTKKTKKAGKTQRPKRKQKGKRRR